MGWFSYLLFLSAFGTMGDHNLTVKLLVGEEMEYSLL